VNQPEAIKIRDLSVRFEETIVFERLNLDIPTQAATCLMGRSGCGKSTLLQVLMGLVKPMNGSITGVADKTVSVVFQENRLCGHLSVMRNILLPVRETAESNNRAQMLLTAVGLDENVWKQKAHELSGGMKRRTAIVRALMPEANLYLLDEPVKELDEENQENVINLILKVTAGKTLIVATHESDDIQRFNAEKLIRLE